MQEIIDTIRAQAHQARAMASTMRRDAKRHRTDADRLDADAAEQDTQAAGYDLAAALYEAHSTKTAPSAPDDDAAFIAAAKKAGYVGAEVLYAPQDEIQYVGLKGEPITKEQNDALIAQSQGREVQHIEIPDEEPVGIPPHVWLYRNMLTDLQAVAPLGRDETNGQYAVAIDQLTPEQAVIPHVARQLDEQNTAR